MQRLSEVEWRLEESTMVPGQKQMTINEKAPMVSRGIGL
jgi:hypothetical protein